jgi:phosphoglycolate phosphatase-like HAD superfamily hydrolase
MTGEHGAPDGATSTTETAAPVEKQRRMVMVGRYNRLLKDMVRGGRSRATVRQSNPYVQQLAKDVLSREGEPAKQVKCLEQTAALIEDIARRGSLEDAEQVGWAMVAIARQAYRESHPEYARQKRSIRELRLLDEQAEAAEDLAETAFDYTASDANRLALLSASSRAIKAQEELNDAVREGLVQC